MPSASSLSRGLDRKRPPCSASHGIFRPVALLVRSFGSSILHGTPVGATSDLSQSIFTGCQGHLPKTGSDHDDVQKKSPWSPLVSLRTLRPDLRGLSLSTRPLASCAPGFA